MSRYHTQGLALSPEINETTGLVLSACIEVHKALGPGLLEGVYESCLKAELRHLGIEFQSQVSLPITYRDVALNTGLRLDFLVLDTVVVELKAVEAVLPVHKSQVMSYLRLANKPVGLLVNFNVAVLRQGVSRILNPNHEDVARHDRSQSHFKTNP